MQCKDRKYNLNSKIMYGSSSNFLSNNKVYRKKGFKKKEILQTL